jgi:AraC-like DNA-binding protein
MIILTEFGVSLQPAWEQENGNNPTNDTKMLPWIMRKESRNDERIARSIAFMSLHLDERIKITQLAERAGLSASYFWALFKQKTGSTPVNFLIRLRMHQACHLLKATDLNVKTVAAVLGYKDSFYFSRQFKSVHGVAPANYPRPDQSVPLDLPRTRRLMPVSASPWDSGTPCT